MEPPPRPPQPSEGARLARALRAGDEERLGEWYAAEYPAVHRLCLGLLASGAEADDAASDAMLHLHDRLERWDPERPYGPWRSRVVVNLCRDRLRRASRRAVHEERAAALRSETVLPHPADAASADELRGVLERSLGKLSPREREAFVLIDLEGSSAAEVAENLELAVSTVRANLSLARRRLRELLGAHLPEGYALEGGAS